MPRPKEFDPGEALDQAVQLFWRQGYEATSVQDLVEHMGINRFSLYDTFGDKHQLYLAALDRYRQKVASESLACLEHSREGLAAIRRYFLQLLDSTTTPQGTKGCLMANSAVEVASRDLEAAARVQAYLAGSDEAFYHALVRAREKGEIRKSASLRDSARFLTTSALGLTTRIKAGAGRKQLEGVVRTIFAALNKS